MEAIWTRKSSHSPADIIRGGPLDCGLIYLLAWSDSVLHLWFCMLKTQQDLYWWSSHPSVILWSCLQLLSDWSRCQVWWWVWWRYDEEECNLMALFRSIMTAWSPRVCFVWACHVSPFSHQACSKWFIHVFSLVSLCIWSGAKHANQSASTPPENTALGPFPSELWCGSWAVRT